MIFTTRGPQHPSSPPDELAAIGRRAWRLGSEPYFTELTPPRKVGFRFPPLSGRTPLAWPATYGSYITRAHDQARPRPIVGPLFLSTTNSYIRSLPAKPSENPCPA